MGSTLSADNDDTSLPTTMTSLLSFSTDKDDEEEEEENDNNRLLFSVSCSAGR
jgi:hypothetical protein